MSHVTAQLSILMTLDLMSLNLNILLSKRIRLAPSHAKKYKVFKLVLTVSLT